jgi:hypothetical protein
VAKITDLDDLVLTFSAGDLGTDADVFVDPDASPPIMQMAPGFSIDADDGVGGQAFYSFLYFTWQYRVKYEFDSGTTSSPAAGELRFNNATLASVTAIYVNVTDGSSAAKSRAKMLSVIADTEGLEVLLADSDWDVDSAAIAKFTVNGTPSLSSGVYTIPVTYASHTGSFSDTNNVMLSPASPFAGKDFPLECISANSGEYLVNQTSSKAWEFANTTTTDLLRDFAWQLVAANGTVLEEWMNITSLGLLVDAANDQPFYWQVDSPTATTTDTVRTGPVNQPVQIYSDASLDNFDYRGFFRISTKEQGDSQIVVDLLTTLALSTLSARIFTFSLSTQSDLKITTADTGIDANADDTADIAPYSSFSISWGTASVDVGDGGGSQPFNRAVIDAGEANATWAEIHEWASWLTRRTGDIDPGAGTRNGKLEEPLTRFEGDRLVTAQGVAIINYNAEDVNNVNAEVTFTDSNGVARTPANPAFISQYDLIFNDVAQNNTNSEYWVYIASTFNTATPALINNNAGSPVAGLVNGAASITIDYGFDTNTQEGRTVGTNTAIVIVVIGADGTKWLKLEATITRSTALEFRLSPNLDRNYVDAA